MLNYKNLFKQAYGDIRVARKVVMTNAMSFVKKLGMTLSEALKRAWKEAKQDVEQAITSLKSYKLRINKQLFDVQGVDFDEVVDNCMEIIANVKGKQFMYNVSNNLYDRLEQAMYFFEHKGTLTFAQDVFIRRV